MQSAAIMINMEESSEKCLFFFFIWVMKILECHLHDCQRLEADGNPPFGTENDNITL